MGRVIMNEEPYTRPDFKPERVDLAAYQEFLRLFTGSDIIKSLQTNPQHLAFRVDGEITGGLMGGSTAYVGVTRQPPGCVIYSAGGKPAVRIDTLKALKDAQVLFLEGAGAPKWSDVSTHPGNYKWQKLISG